MVQTRRSGAFGFPEMVWGIGIALMCAIAPGLRGAELPASRTIQGVAIDRPIEGKPYALAGKRVVFTNWYYVDPGDLDWRDDSGKSVYVKGNSGAFEAHHVGIRAPEGIRIIVEKPAVIGPMERPHRSILQDGAIYRGWTDNEYYESTDGMHWEKKAPVVFQGDKGDGIYQVFIDRSAPPDERFKSIWATDSITREQFDQFRKKHPDGWGPRALLHLDRGEVGGVCGRVSADGITWRTLPDPLVIDYCDSLNTCYYDPLLRKYVMYTRTWSVGPQAASVEPDIGHSWTDVGRRAIGRTESADFRYFPPPRMIVEPTPDLLPSEQIYTNCHTTVPGAPDQHLMFPAIWNASINDTTRIALLSSHDGRIWHWVPGGDRILETQAFGQWNGGCVWATPDLIELPDGDWALPYMAHNFPHKYPRGQVKGSLGYAIWPKGRLVGIEAAEQGRFTMIPVVAPGRRLRINALTERAGWIKVEVLGNGGRTLEDCVPIVGDQAWTTVSWKGAQDLGIEPGQAVTLRFELYHARLFGAQFE